MTHETPAPDAPESTNDDLSPTTQGMDDIPAAIPKDVPNPGNGAAQGGAGDAAADIPAAIPKDTSDTTPDV